MGDLHTLLFLEALYSEWAMMIQRFVFSLGTTSHIPSCFLTFAPPPSLSLSVCFLVSKSDSRQQQQQQQQSITTTSIKADLLRPMPSTTKKRRRRMKLSLPATRMLSILVGFSVLLMLDIVNGQEYPNPELQTTQFDTTKSFRQYVCDRQTQYDEGSIEFLADSLEGLEIRAILDENSPYFRLDSEGKIDEDYPGLIVVLMDEIARLGKFTWRNSYTTYAYDETSNRTWTDLLIWSADTYDVVADSYTINFDRQNRGISFPESWFDASEVLIGRKNQQEGSNDEVFNAWSFLYPFDDVVWYTIGATMIFSGLLYTFLVAIDPYSDRRKIEKKPVAAIFDAAMGFAGHMEFETQTHPARLFSFSLAMWSLLMVSAYTANLASFLVVRNTPTQGISSIEDVVRQEEPICVKSDTATAEGLKRDFPIAVIVEKPNEEDIFKSVLDGECSFALTTMSKWQVYERDANVNDGCQLAWIGRVYKHREGGMATISDSGTQCTSLIRDVFSLHLLKMKHEGFIQDAWNEHLQRLETNDCAALSTQSYPTSSGGGSSDGEHRRRRLAKGSSNADEGPGRNTNGDGRRTRRLATGSSSKSSSGGGVAEALKSGLPGDLEEQSLEDLRLNITNMGGIFILHGVLSLLAIIMALIHRWFGLTKRRNKERREKYLAQLESRLAAQKEIGMLSTLTERRDYILRRMKRHKKTSGYGIDSMVREPSVLFKNDTILATENDDDYDESISNIDNVGSSVFHRHHQEQESSTLYPTNSQNLDEGLATNHMLGDTSTNYDTEVLKKTIMLLNSRQDQQIKALEHMRTEMNESRQEMYEQISILMKMVAATTISSSSKQQQTKTD